MVGDDDPIEITYDDIKKALGESDNLFSKTGFFYFRIKYKADGETEWRYSSTKGTDKNESSSKKGRFKKDIPINENELYVQDNHLHAVLDEGVNLKIDSYISVFNDTTINKKNIKDDVVYVDEKPYEMVGPYKLIFTRNPTGDFSFCPVELEVYVPEVEYKFVDDDKLFWHPGEDRNDAIKLKFAYPSKTTESDARYNFSFKFESGKIGRGVSGGNEFSRGEIRVPGTIDMSGGEVYNYVGVDYSIIKVDTSLHKITTKPTTSTKKFIPVINTFDLKAKAYPNITAESVELIQPACSDSNAKLKITNLKGGLGGDYVYAVNNGVDTCDLSVSNNVAYIDLGNTISGYEYKVTILDKEPEELKGKTKCDGRAFIINEKMKDPNFTINRPEPFSITDTSYPNNLCADDNSGVIEITTSHDNVKSYAWSQMVNEEYTPLEFYGPTASEVSAGRYRVIVENDNGCKDTVMFPINQWDLPNIKEMSTTDISCFDKDDGKIVATVEGVSPFDYKWDIEPSRNSNEITGLKDGEYKLTVTDANGCKNTATATINRPDTVEVKIEKYTHVSCFDGNDGKILASVSQKKNSSSSDRFNFSYQFTDEGGEIVSNDLEYSEAKAGVYTFTVSWYNGKCSLSEEKLTITQPSEKLNIESFPESPIQLNCFGDQTETAVEPVVSGGTKGNGYTYRWTKENDSEFSAFTHEVNNLSAGKYIFTVKDDHGCTASKSLEVTQPEKPLTVEIVADGENCFGGKYNLATKVSGGNGGYTYLWSDNSTDEKIDNVQLPISYSVTVKDVKGCEAETSATIEQPEELKISSIKSTGITCKDGENVSAENGRIEVSAEGGSGTLNYYWTRNDQTYPNPENYYIMNNLAPGKYQIKVEDGSKCSVLSEEIELVAPQLLSSNMQITHVNCYGDDSGKINPGIKGGSKNYTFVWSNGKNTPELSGLVAGTYKLTVKDVQNNCTLIWDNLMVKQPESPLSVSVNESNSSDCDKSSGYIHVDVDGGTEDYTYAWTNVALDKVVSTSQDLNDVPNGQYTLLVTDYNGCEYSIDHVLSALQGPSVTVQDVKDVNCFGGSDGEIGVTVTGGTEGSGYSYLWTKKDDNEFKHQGKNLSTIGKLSVGKYQLVVTDVRGCSSEPFVADIFQPTEALYINPPRVIPVSCFGGNNGRIVTTMGGGTPNYTIEWTKKDSVFTANTNNISGLYAGSFNIKVTDANNCTFTIENIEVTQPEKALSVDFIEVTDVTCNGYDDGKLKAKANGGTSSYTYSWSNDKQGELIDNLAPGKYTVTVVDGNKCTVSDTKTITEPGQLGMELLEHTNVTCFGAQNGALEAKASGGVGSYSYSWKADKDNNYSATTDAVSGLAPDTYIVTVADANGCAFSIENIEITQPAQLKVWEVMDSHTDISCFGGSDGRIFTRAEGGTGHGTYSYKWNIDSTSAQITNITAGEYSLVVTDGNNCEASIDKIVVTQPEKLVAKLESLTDVSCYGAKTGSIEMSVTGGTMSYTYKWDNKESENADLENIPAGTYKFVVNDSHGCETDTVKVEIKQQPKIVISTESTPAHCSKNDGSITASVEGGFGEYKFLWMKGSEKTAYTASKIEGLSTGVYKLKVTDGYNCSDSVNITVEPMDGPKVEEVASTQTTCYHGSDGSIEVIKVTGGEGSSYTYSWTHDAKEIGTGSKISGLKAGEYFLTVTDNANCQAYESVSVGQSDSVMVAESQVVDVLCHGGNTGNISVVSTTGGNGGYSYLWSNGSTAPSISGLVIGTYTLTITDQKGCKGSFSQSISQPEKLEVSLVSAREPLCHGGSEESYIEAKAQGGNVGQRYDYKWTCGDEELTSSSNKITNIPAGTYQLVVTDYKGCEALMEYTLGQPTHVRALISNVGDVLCHGGSDGYLEASAQGGTPGYLYDWDNGAAGSSISNLGARNYRLVVTDSHGCHDTIFQAVGQPEPLQVSATVKDALCNGYSDGLIETRTQGGTMPYTYLWSDGSSLDHLGNLSIGTYKVVVTDAHKCQDSLSQAIQQPDALRNSIEPQHVVCQDSELTIDDGDNGFDSYHWILPSQNIEEGRLLTITPSMPQGKYIMVSRKGECYTADTTEVSFSDKVLPVKFLMASETYLSDTLVVVEDSKIDGDYNWTFSFSPDMFEDITADVASEHGNLRYLYVRDAGIDTITMYADNGVCHASISKSVSVIDSYRPEALDYSIVASGVFSKLQIGPNPNNGDFTLFANLSDAAMLDVALYDVQRSRRIQLDMSSYNAEADHFEIPFQGLGLASGAYTLLVSANGDTRQIKFVVE